MRKEIIEILNNCNIDYKLITTRGGAEFILTKRYEINYCQDFMKSIKNIVTGSEIKIKDPTEIIKFLKMNDEEFKNVASELFQKEIEEFNKKAPKRRIRRTV